MPATIRNRDPHAVAAALIAAASTVVLVVAIVAEWGDGASVWTLYVWANELLALAYLQGRAAASESSEGGA